MKVSPKKHLGQHFLKDDTVSKRIADKVFESNQIVEEVLEIGPGMGALTQFLINRGKKITVMEIDTESVDYLNQNPAFESLVVIETDFLRDKLNVLGDDVALCGNFPYNISSQIVFKLLDERNRFPLMVGMFQKEVAERVVAQHGSKTYGILSVLAQFYYEGAYMFTVDENVFIPPPKVKSGVISLERRATSLLKHSDYAFAKHVVKAAFNQRRKMLRVSLKQFSKLFKEEDQWSTLRPEQLSVLDFAKLVDDLYLRQKDSSKPS